MSTRQPIRSLVDVPRLVPAGAISVDIETVIYIEGTTRFAHNSANISGGETEWVTTLRQRLIERS